jgi:dual-specificity kinase
MASTFASSEAAMRRESSDKKRRPDWNEFYKNGVPAEIIVIDDDTPPPNGQRRQNGYAAASQHTDKRQRTGNAAFEPAYHQSAATTYSATQTPYYENSASTDRTTSAYVATAPTSLGSTTSNGTYLPPLEDGTVGQKRKRTRAQVAEDVGPAKRREIERLTPPHLLYVPPEKPIVKAKEVHVEVIRDVCSCPAARRKFCAHTQQKKNANERFDDEDGHYNVVAGANLTERCMLIPVEVN